MPFWRSKNARREQMFLENGSVLTEELIAACDGKTNPIRIFSAAQILKATNNFDRSCLFCVGEEFWYKGEIQGRLYMIKKYKYIDVEDTSHRKEKVYRDIVVSSQMSGHCNSLRLIGCCLEFPVPVMVCDFAEHGILNNAGGIDKQGTLPWKIRLKIAKEISSAVTYMHTAFPRIIIHKDIKPSHILLDKNWTAKLADYSLSISIPEGELQVEDVAGETIGFREPMHINEGTIGFIEPQYIETGIVTEYTDVFSFGIFSLVLLTGKPSYDRQSYRTNRDRVCYLLENGRGNEIADPDMIKCTSEAERRHQEQQMEAFLRLALRCSEYDVEKRPKMIEVAKELRRIEKSTGVPSLSLCG